AAAGRASTGPSGLGRPASDELSAADDHDQLQKLFSIHAWRILAAQRWARATPSLPVPRRGTAGGATPHARGGTPDENRSRRRGLRPAPILDPQGARSDPCAYIDSSFSCRVLQVASAAST